jgi:peptidylprolyl isomerase
MMRRFLILLGVLATSLASVVAPAAHAVNGTTTPADPLAGVTVGPAASTIAPEPVLRFPKGFSVGKTTHLVSVTGTGEAVQDGSFTLLQSILVDARTGELLQSSFRGPPPLVKVDLTHAMPAIVDAVVGTTVGSRVLLAIPPSDTKDRKILKAALGPRPTVHKNDVLVFLFDVKQIRHPLSQATGETLAADPALPGVTRDGIGRPTIAKPAGSPPTTIVSQTLVQGTGAPVQDNQTVVAQYRYWVWASGNQVDSTWDRTVPVTFQVGQLQVVGNWDAELVGVPVGSEVMVVLPPDKAFGDGKPPSGVSATDTLVFVVDILDAY